MEQQGEQEEKGKVRKGEGGGLKRPLLILLIAGLAFLRPSPRNSSSYPPSNLVQGNFNRDNVYGRQGAENQLF